MESSGKRVLVVDDEYWIRAVIIQMLKTEGYLVKEASDGDAAIDILRLGHVDLMLIDMSMPGKNGNDTIIDCRRQYPDLGIIAMSGALYRESYLQSANGLGANAILQKPFSQHSLIYAIQDICG
ncbi:MAG: response regulator [Chitinivibrionales bacterium]